MGILRLRADRETFADPVLDTDEFGYDEETGRFCRGNGSSPFSSLSEVGSGTYASSVVLPTSHGAVGDGVADDGAALLAAATAAVAAGLPLLINKPYKVTSTVALPPGTAVQGTRAGAITGSVAGAAVVSLGSGCSLTGPMALTNTHSDCIVVGIRAGAVDTSVVGVRIIGSTGAQGVSCNALGIRGLLVDRCLFDGIGYGVLTNFGAEDISNVRVTNNTFVNVFADAVELNHPFGGPADGVRSTARDFVVSGNYIECTSGSGSTAGLAIGAAGVSDLVISGNTIAGSRREGIHVEDDARNVSIADNVLSDVVELGIAIYTSTRGVAISGNVIRSAGICGVKVINATGTVPTGELSISANTITGGGVGISVGGQSPAGGNCAIVGNVVSATTGNGIELVGWAGQLHVASNIIDGCGGWGIARTSGGATSWTVAANMIRNCTSGDVQGAGGGAIAMDRRTARTVSGVSTGAYTPKVSIFRLGSFASGVLRCEFRASSGAWCEQAYQVIWTASTLKHVQLMSRVSGTIDAGVFQVVDGVLTGEHFVGGAGTTVEAFWEFHGTIVEDGQVFTGTVNRSQGGTGPLVADSVDTVYGRHKFQGADPATTPFAIQGATSQSADSFVVQDSGSTKHLAVKPNGAVIVETASRGLVLRDTNGVYYRLTVSTAGALVVTALADRNAA